MLTDNAQQIRQVDLLCVMRRSPRIAILPFRESLRHRGYPRRPLTCYANGGWLAPAGLRCDSGEFRRPTFRGTPTRTGDPRAAIARVRWGRDPSIERRTG